MTWWAGIFRDTDRFARPSGEGGYALTAKITGLPFRTKKQRMLHVELSVTLRDPPDGTTRFRARHGPATGPQLVDTGFIEATRDTRASFATVLRCSPNKNHFFQPATHATPAAKGHEMPQCH